MSGTPSLIFRIARGRRVFHANAAVVARVNERAELAEMWSYVNPGAVLAFPSHRRAVPPDPSGVPGNEADALAVALQWERAVAWPELLEQVLASALPECVVHGTNADLGDVSLLEDHFRITHTAFPDLTVRFEPGFVAGDRLISQFTLDGTQQGWLGIAPPSGARVQSTGAIVARVTAERRVQELWIYLAPGMGLIFPRTDQ